MITDSDSQDSMDQSAGRSVAHRVDLTCLSAGLAPPPVRVHMKFYSSADKWRVFAFTEPGQPPSVARWLEPFAPQDLKIAPGVAPKYLRADFRDLPSPWDGLVCGATVPYLELMPTGALSIFVEDQEKNVQAFVRSVRERFPQDGAVMVREHWRDKGWKELGLTPRQYEVLSTAVAWGYYEVPHKVTLRSLAEKLGVSVGAISELLRRAEAQVIKAYVDASSDLNAALTNQAAKFFKEDEETADQRRQRMLSSST